MTTASLSPDRSGEDAISNVLKWVLLLVAIGTFAGLGWATVETYRAAPPQPDRYVTADGAVVMTNADIVAGKSGFQRADLMDYGSLYGMGSYFGEDYTASNLVALATLTQTNIAIAQFGKPYAELRPEQQWLAHSQMQAQLHGLDVEPQQVVPIQGESADGCFEFYPAVWAMPVVAVQPDRQLGGAAI
jgi:nitric oxide reductase subunit B